MRLFRVTLAFAAFFVTFPAHGGQPADSPPADLASPPEDRLTTRSATRWPGSVSPRCGCLFPSSRRRPTSRRRPMQSPPCQFLPPPTPEIWQPQWQEELGLSAEQKKKLLAINAKAVAEAKDHAEQFKKLSPEEQKAQVKAWAGKSAPWRQQLDNEVCSQIEAVLTPQQLQTLKDFSFPVHAIGLLYDAKIRQEIGFSHRTGRSDFVALPRRDWRGFKRSTMERAEKLWDMLTPQQQAALPEVVKRQGPTSAVLSIAWDLGFDLDNFVPGYPMLAEAPVRKRLGLSAEQEKQLHAVMADSAARKEKARQERLSRNSTTVTIRTGLGSRCEEAGGGHSHPATVDDAQRDQFPQAGSLGARLSREEENGRHYRATGRRLSAARQRNPRATVPHRPRDARAGVRDSYASSAGAIARGDRSACHGKPRG